MTFAKIISIFFFLVPLFLMFMIPILRKKTQKIYWGTLLGFSIILLLTSLIFQIRQPLRNGPLTQLFCFILGPTLICFSLSLINFLWKKVIVGIICIPVFYFLGWVIFINIGMLLGILVP